jgi:hypothetical protein
MKNMHRILKAVAVVAYLKLYIPTFLQTLWNARPGQPATWRPFEAANRSSVAQSPHSCAQTNSHGPTSAVLFSHAITQSHYPPTSADQNAFNTFRISRAFYRAQCQLPLIKKNLYKSTPHRITTVEYTRPRKKRNSGHIHKSWFPTGRNIQASFALWTDLRN